MFATEFVRHPDGGWTPAEAALRGTLEATCPNCGAVVIRDASAQAIANTGRLKCLECGQHLLGGAW